MLTAYPHSQIDTGVYEINEFDGASMFLIEGTERALLIDTGVGRRNRQLSESSGVPVKNCCNF